MKLGTLIARRFEVVSSGARWQPVLGLDRRTGGSVRVVDIPTHYFLDRAAIETQAELVRALGDPTLVPPLHIGPLVIPVASKEPELAPSVLVDLALELVDAVGRAWRAGICVNPGVAWIDDEGVLRLPAPSGLPGLHVEAYGREDEYIGRTIAGWLEQRVERGREWCGDSYEPIAVARLLAERATDPHAARQRVDALGTWPQRFDIAIDFDRGIALGEAKLRKGLERFEAQYANMPLAAAYHHRACVRWQQGQARSARKDIARACELDRHARYLTTAAIIAKRNPGPLHDDAVCALARKRRPDTYNTEFHYLDRNGRQVETRAAARDAARTFHARAVHRAKTGERAGAIADLEESLAHDPTPGARALLDRLNRDGP